MFLWLWTGCDFLLPPAYMKVSKCCSGYRFQQEFISTRMQFSSVIINIPGSAGWSHCKAICSLTASLCFCNRWRVQVTFRRRLQVRMSQQSFTRLSSLTDSGIIFYPHMQTWFTLFFTPHEWPACFLLIHSFISCSTDQTCFWAFLKISCVLGWVLGSIRRDYSGKQPQHI